MAKVLQTGSIFPNPELDTSDVTTLVNTAIAAHALAERAIQTIAVGGAAQTLNVNSYACFELTLTADCTLTLTDPTPTDGLFSFVLYTIEGNGGGWDIVLPGTVLFDGGNQPAPATAVTTITKYVFTCRRVGGISTWDVTMAADGLAV